MKSFARSAFLSLSLATVSVSAVACGGSVEQPQTTASAASKAPVAQNSHGMVKVFGDALGEVALRPDQRTEIEKLAADAETRHAPLAADKKDVMLTFADQVEKGTIDRAALQPKIDKATADIEAARNDDRAALVKLHALLDADQRNAFVDALEKQMHAKHGEHGAKGHMGAAGFMKMKQLADDLKLTDEQRSKIHDVMKEARKEGFEGHKGEGGPHGRPDFKAEWKGHHGGKKAMEAFREDKLDLDKVAPPHDVKAMTKLGADHMTGFAEKVLPILTPEQRKIAADKLREMANSGDSLLVH